MTFSTLGYAHDSATHPAQALRQMVGAGYMTPVISHANAVDPTTRGGGYGVIGNGLAVTFTSGLGYSCSAGVGVVTDTHALGHGAFTVQNDAAVAGTLAARDATNPRKSLIAVRVRNGDVDSSGGEDVGMVEIAGTPGASPAVPAIPSTLGSLLILSEVLVPVSGNPTFTEKRQYATATGGIVRCKSSLRPSGGALFDGLFIYETDTKLRYHYNATALAWCLDSPRIIQFGTVYQGLAGGVHTLIGADTTALTTDASGYINIPFGITFQASPITSAMGGDAAGQPIAVNLYSVSTTSFTVRCHTVAGAVVASGVVAINWIAAGFV